ncbi:hypothetical protein FGU65_05260 [Methanoculleus sp. FWC-SCC1]|uniref:Dockerin domain-containing protein n=1 Tax=Methanoculleus frigidifontis TaxID=2584085 RepID=A0ABT8M8Q1_9EURY|nr:S8 family serine peptidase [Methanoculleus sp. FWC-SCC1]MDN7024305.1 hypothetical protein [Methanoculleus sp. FWC-SCC1]
MRLSNLQAGLLVLLIVLLMAGTAAALPFDNRFIMPDPPTLQDGERIPVFLVLEEQPQQFTSFAQLKADVTSQQTQVLQSIRTIDAEAFDSATTYWIANAIWIEADPAALESYAAIPGVARIEPDLVVTAYDPVVDVSATIDPDSIKRPGTYETSVVWSADYIEAPSVWDTGNVGDGVTIAVIDTGIDGSHPAFGDRIVAFADFVNGDNATAYDDNGHGTHCAGTAAGGTVTTTNYAGEIDVTLGIAPEADLMGAKVLNAAGSGSTSAVLSGVQWAVENGADVISMSLGSYPYRMNEALQTTLTANETEVVTLEVSSEKYGDTGYLYEPQFVIGRVQVYDAGDLQNLTITVKDANGNTASGEVIDWLGFDQPDDRFYFKAPYASNTGSWNGNWEISVKNNGSTDVDVLGIRLTEYYQSDGTTLEDTAINNVVAGGVIVAASAGNNGYYGTSTVGTPGTAADIITVGATEYLMDYRAAFSSMGPVNRSTPYIKPDVMAPGVGVISAYPGNKYAVMDGTSMACPAVAGTAALMLSGNSSLTPADVKSAMMQTAVHIAEDGAIQAVMQPNNAYGAGRINAYEAVNRTGGLGGSEPSDGIIRELFGGSLAPSSGSGDTLPLLAVLWNTTAGTPIIGEDVNFSVRYSTGSYPYYQTVYINQTGTTDENGSVIALIDIANVPTGRSCSISITWDGREVTDSFYKYTAPTPTPATVPIFDRNTYSVNANDTVEIKYPLLNADGSAYTESVAFTISNWSETIVSETFVPENGVIAYSLDLAETDVGDSSLSIYINDRQAGNIYIDTEPHSYQESVVTPERAICPPGMSIDIGVMAFPHHGGTTVSKDFDVYVTTLTETDVLSLSAGNAETLTTGEVADMAALLEEIDAMKPSTYTGTVTMTNGLGLFEDLTMPENGYIAIVRFVSDDGYMEYTEEQTALVYGTLEPWLLHRSTPPAVEEDLNRTMTWLWSTGTWPATWDQIAYTTVPGDAAFITAYGYEYDPAAQTEEPAADQTVYLYTQNGVQTGVTNASGMYTFTVDVTGQDEQLPYLLVTDGIDGGFHGYIGGTPFSVDDRSRVGAGLVAARLGAPIATGNLYPDSAERSVEIERTGASYAVTASSYGPDGTEIQEKGYFACDRQSENDFWYLGGTEKAAVVGFTGTHTESATPGHEGWYQTRYVLLDPTSQGGRSYSLYSSFHNPDRSVSYTLGQNIGAGTAVPVTFNASTDAGAALSGARVVLKLGAAADEDWIWPSGDPRDYNILTATGWYPDPYTGILTGYTDATGKVTLTFTAPTASQQALRKSLADRTSVPYTVTCFHNGEIVQSDYGSFSVTEQQLPDFYPGVSAPHVVKLERNDVVTVRDVVLTISNVGTAGYTYADPGVKCTAEAGSHNETTYFQKNLAVGETKTVLATTIARNAADFGINTSDYRLPVDIDVGITVNSDRQVEELNYLNNRIVHPVRITAPDLKVDILAPQVTTPFSTTQIGLKVTNLGEVGSEATTLIYGITGTPDETITVPALGSGASTTVWRNQTLVGGAYLIEAEVNPNHATDYETTYENNVANLTVNSYAHTLTHIRLPQDRVLVPGTTYDLPIVVDNVTDLAAYQMAFTFDGSVVEVQSISPGALPVTAQNIGSGSAVFNGAATAGVSGTVTVATIRISVIGASGDETDLNLTARLWDANEFEIPVEVTNGNADLLLYGDANNDGEVNQLDTLHVLREVVGLIGKPTAGTTRFFQTDVTGNSAIEVGDAMFIAQYNADLRDAYFRIL